MRCVVARRWQLNVIEEYSGAGSAGGCLVTIIIIIIIILIIIICFIMIILIIGDAAVGADIIEQGTRISGHWVVEHVKGCVVHVHEGRVTRTYWQVGGANGDVVGEDKPLSVAICCCCCRHDA